MNSAPGTSLATSRLSGRTAASKVCVKTTRVGTDIWTRRLLISLRRVASVKAASSLVDMLELAADDI
jgi:hypothetical protein